MYVYVGKHNRMNESNNNGNEDTTNTKFKIDGERKLIF